MFCHGGHALGFRDMAQGSQQGFTVFGLVCFVKCGSQVFIGKSRVFMQQFHHCIVMGAGCCSCLVSPVPGLPVFQRRINLGLLLANVHYCAVVESDNPPPANRLGGWKTGVFYIKNFDGSAQGARLDKASEK